MIKILVYATLLCLLVALTFATLSMMLWWWDLIRSSSKFGYYDSLINKGLQCGYIMFKVFEVLFFSTMILALCVYWWES